MTDYQRFKCCVCAQSSTGTARCSGRPVPDDVSRSLPGGGAGPDPKRRRNAHRFGTQLIVLLAIDGTFAEPCRYATAASRPVQCGGTNAHPRWFQLVLEQWRSWGRGRHTGATETVRPSAERERYVGLQQSVRHGNVPISGPVRPVHQQLPAVNIGKSERRADGRLRRCIDGERIEQFAAQTAAAACQHPKMSQKG